VWRVFWLTFSISVVGTFGPIRQDSLLYEIVDSWKKSESIGQEGLSVNGKVFLKKGMCLSNIKLPENKMAILGMNDRYIFRLVATTSPNPIYGLEFVDEPSDGFFGDALGFAKAPFFVGWNSVGFSLLDILQDRNYMVQRVGAEVVDETECIHFTWKRHKGSSDDVFPEIGDFWVSKSHGYAIKKYEYGSSVSHSGLVSQYQQLQGCYFPSVILIGKANGLNTMKATYKIEDVPDENFFLPHYGFPDPDIGRKPSISLTRIVCFVLVGAGVLLLWMKFRQ
jgi:hypothetical protein